MTDRKHDAHMVEEAVVRDQEAHISQVRQPVGTVQLLLNDEVVLIPTPSPDPKDPLNLPSWRKWAILLLMAFYGSTAILLASGMGAIYPVVLQAYPGEELRANDLITYPTLFMGLGNLIGMPMALAIGRRPVFIVTMIVLVASGIGCALAPNLSAHIAFRNIMSLAAGQSEALCPMIVQEVHFLHERGRKLAWFATIECIVCAAFFIATTPLVKVGGWRWWYGAFTVINGVIFVFTIVFMTETMYERPDDASEGAVHLTFNEKGEMDSQGSKHEIFRVTTQHGVVLEPERYGKRTWKGDLKFCCVTPKWDTLIRFYWELLQCLCIPTMFWLLLVNGAFLGLYIFTAGTFAQVLIPPPYSIPFEDLGYMFIDQIVSCVVFLPLLGYGNDLTTKLISRMRSGVYQPEYRLIPLIIPTIVAVVCGVMYGQAAQFPAKYSWAAIAVTFNGTFFAFLGANIVGLTYAIDSFPLRAAPVLVLICAGRGIISFGLSYSVLPAINAIGYDGTMKVESIIAGVLALLGIPLYFLGPRLRALADRWFNLSGQRE